MREFFARAEDLHERHTSGENTQEVIDMGLVRFGRSALQAVHSKVQFDLENIETLFSAFEMARMFGRSLGASLTPDDVVELPNAMRRVIVRTLQWAMPFEIGPSRELTPPRPWADFAYRVISPLVHRGDRVCLITFNYDVGLDVALEACDFTIDYCLSRKREPRPRTIELAKLHGSMNWYGCARCGVVATDHVREFAGRVGPPLPDAAFVLDFANLLPQVCPQCRGAVTAPWIVPPTWNKGDLQQRLAVVWARASTMLSEARSLIIAGYSWPESDQYFRQLCGVGLVGDEFLRRLWVFDPSRGTRARIREQLFARHLTENGDVYAERDFPFSWAVRKMADGIRPDGWRLDD